MTCKAAVTGGLSAGPAERECVGCEVARFLWRGPGQHVAAFGIGDGDLVLDERPAGRVRSRDVAATAFLVWSLPLGMSSSGPRREASAPNRGRCGRFPNVTMYKHPAWLMHCLSRATRNATLPAPRKARGAAGAEQVGEDGVGQGQAQVEHGGHDAVGEGESARLSRASRLTSNRPPTSKAGPSPPWSPRSPSSGPRPGTARTPRTKPPPGPTRFPRFITPPSPRP